MTAPRLVGVIHLPALPGSPRAPADAKSGMRGILQGVARDAKLLAECGFGAAILENFGDAPFVPGAVESVTTACLAVCAKAAADAAPTLPLGINVLRNDASAALGIAIATGARFIRINVHAGAAVTDQGIIEGQAHRTTRERRAWGGDDIELWVDVDVKHARPLGPRPLAEITHDVVGRGLASAVLVTGVATGAAVDGDALVAVAGAAEGRPVYVASGARTSDLPRLRKLGAHGVIVGSALRADGRAGGPIDEEAARTFAESFARAFA